MPCKALFEPSPRLARMALIQLGTFLPHRLRQAQTMTLARNQSTRRAHRYQYRSRPVISHPSADLAAISWINVIRNSTPFDGSSQSSSRRRTKAGNSKRLAGNYCALSARSEPLGTAIRPLTGACKPFPDLAQSIGGRGCINAAVSTLYYASGYARTQPGANATTQLKNPGEDTCSVVLPT